MICGIIDSTKNKLVRSYYCRGLRRKIPLQDSKYVYFEIESDKHALGYSLDGELNPIYDDGHTPANPDDFEPKISKQVMESHAKKDFRSINYKTELEDSLFPKRTMIHGQVIKVDWYSDEALSDLVLTVDITYNRDAVGFAIDRTTVRSWINGNGDVNPKIKTTKKKYNINVEDAIAEGKRRRKNIVDAVQLPVISFMVETLAPLTIPEILLIGRAFMDDMEDFFNKFISNSSTITDIEDPNIGRKSIVVELERKATTDATWLNNTPLQLDPTGNTSILQYLVYEFSI